MREESRSHAYIDGRPATVADLVPLAFAGFAHFTAMQLRESKVRGLDLHLERLRGASTTLFGRAVPDETLREHLRIAVDEGSADMSLTVTIFSRAGEFTRSGSLDDPAVLVRTSPASGAPAAPLRLSVVEHERWLPGIKLVGEGAKTFFLRQAASTGLDDAAFVDRSGRISEATIWNLAFWDGETVVWPNADALPGVTMQIVRRQLAMLKVPQRVDDVALDRLSQFSGAAVLNSWSPGISVSAFGQTDMASSGRLISVLHAAYDAEPAQYI